MYRTPPIKYNFENKIRKVGYEIEYSGIEIRDSVDIVLDLYGGEVECKNRYYYDITNSNAGDFTVKIDSSFLYQKKYKELLQKLGFRDLPDTSDQDFLVKLEDLLENIASGFIPHEIVTPPVSLENLDAFDPMVEKMKKYKAVGTTESIIFAFATHINPETPSLETPVILNYLKAFLLLYEWLYKKLDIDFTRKISSFIEPFDKKYIEKILNTEYDPDMKAFISDYIEFNPKRDRPLDLYPLLAYIEPEVKKKEGSGIVKERPTFHYRLPNSEIDTRQWSLSYEWNYWWYVEKLASEEDELRQLSEKYLALSDRFLVNFRSNWLKTIDEWAEKKQINR